MLQDFKLLCCLLRVKSVWISHDHTKLSFLFGGLIKSPIAPTDTSLENDTRFLTFFQYRSLLGLDFP